MMEFMNLDCQKKLLSYHLSFNVMDLFREMDSENKGYLTAENFEQYFSQYEDMAGTNYLELIRFWSRNT